MRPSTTVFNCVNGPAIHAKLAGYWVSALAICQALSNFQNVLLCKFGTRMIFPPAHSFLVEPARISVARTIKPELDRMARIPEARNILKIFEKIIFRVAVFVVHLKNAHAQKSGSNQTMNKAIFSLLLYAKNNEQIPLSFTESLGGPEQPTLFRQAAINFASDAPAIRDRIKSLKGWNWLPSLNCNRRFNAHFAGLLERLAGERKRGAQTPRFFIYNLEGGNSYG